MDIESLQYNCSKNNINWFEPTIKYDNGDYIWITDTKQLSVMDVAGKTTVIVYNRNTNKLETSSPKDLTPIQILAKYEEYINL